jgi:menaquinone-dependent protoporphyrinogen oxidase
MKPAGIFYATREGQTQRIAQHIAQGIRAGGLEAELCNLSESPHPDNLLRYSAVILAASVHAGKHEPEMVVFAQHRRDDLEALPHVFVSVTLSQTGAQDLARPAAERARFAADVESVIEKFRQDTGWHPKRVKPVAGALTYSKYNFFLRFIMKRIARKAGVPTDTSRDYEFTDWQDLDTFARGFAADVRKTAMQQA